MPTVLITGASRGLGLEFARQYSSSGWRVIATCRDSDTTVALKEIIGDIHIRIMDITNSNQILAVASEFKEEKIDVLLNNASIFGPNDERATFGTLEIMAWVNVMLVNTIAPLKVTEAFINNVMASNQKKIVFISSRSSSISERGLLPHHKRKSGSYIYRSSKAALNSAARNLAYDLAPKGIVVLVIHPGWVRTDMGGEEAIMDKQASVFSMSKVINEISINESGSFLNYDGEVISW